MKEWAITFRLEDSPEVRKRVALLLRHAWVKYKEADGGMKAETMSEFLRFLINYYHSREVAR